MKMGVVYLHHQKQPWNDMFIHTNMSFSESYHIHYISVLTGRGCFWPWLLQYLSLPIYLHASSWSSVVFAPNILSLVPGASKVLSVSCIICISACYLFKDLKCIKFIPLQTLATYCYRILGCDQSKLVSCDEVLLYIVIIKWLILVLICTFRKLRVLK